MGVQVFGPEAAIDGFDEGVVGRLAGPREVQGDNLRLGPRIQAARHELRSLVDADRSENS